MTALLSNANITSTDPITDDVTVNALSQVPVVHVLCCPACRFTALALAPLAAHWTEAHPGMSACSLRLYGCTACSSTATERHLMGQHCQLFHPPEQQAGVILLREEILPSVPMWLSKEKECIKDAESSIVSSPINANAMDVDEDDKIDPASLSASFLTECQSSSASNAGAGSATGSKRRKQNTPGRCKLSPPSPQPQLPFSLTSLHQKQVQLLQRSQGSMKTAPPAPTTVQANSLHQQFCQENAQDLSLSAVKRELKQHVKMNESRERSRNTRTAHKKDDNEEALDMRINKAAPARLTLSGPAVVTSSPLPMFNGHSHFSPQMLQQNPLTSTAMAAAIAAAAAAQSSTTASASMTLADLAMRCQNMRPLFRPIHESPLVDVLTHLGSADSPPLNSHSGCSSHGSEASQQDGLCGGGGGSDSTGTGSRSRPQRQNFSPTQNKVLMEWYMEHRDKPYPSTEETKELARRSGLQYSQVKKWFANKRARTQLCQRRLTKSESGSRPHHYDRNQSSSGELSPGQVFQNGVIPSGYDTSPPSPTSSIPTFISGKSDNSFYYSTTEGLEPATASPRASQLPLMTLTHSVTSSGAASPITP